MVSVCDCFKKTEDKGLVHSACFKKHLARFENDRRPTHCPRCKKKYRVRVSFRWLMVRGGRGGDTPDTMQQALRASCIVVTIQGTPLSHHRRVANIVALYLPPHRRMHRICSA